MRKSLHKREKTKNQMEILKLKSTMIDVINLIGRPNDRAKGTKEILSEFEDGTIGIILHKQSIYRTFHSKVEHRFCETHTEMDLILISKDKSQQIFKN